MNEAIIENYLGNLQGFEPEYMTEGIREFFGKFDKVALKKTVEKVHNAFQKGDGRAFDEVAQKTARMTKLPKYQEVNSYMAKLKEEHPEVEKSSELAKKVMRNTFKIKDKAKLEIIGAALGMTAWVKSKGGRYDTMKMTRDTLKEVHTKTMHIYDTGFDDYEATTPEEEKMKEKLQSQAKKQEKIEMIIVGVILAVLAAAIIWAGVTIWGILTSPVTIGIGIIFVWLMVLFKSLLWVIGIGTPVVLAVLAFMKAKG